MKNKLAVFTFILICNGLGAQKITLEEATRRALDHRQELKAQALEIRIAAAQNDRLRAGWLPQLSAVADLRWNTQLQTNILPIGEFGIPGIPAGTTQEVAFGTHFNNLLGIQADQKIYDGHRKIDRALNDADLESEQNQLALTEIDIRYAVAEAYYGVLFQREKTNLAEQTLSREQVNLETGQTRFKDGTLLKNDLDRLSLDLSNAELHLRKARQNLALSLDHLRYLIRADSGAAPEPSDDLAALMAARTVEPDSLAQARPEIRSEEIKLHINELNQKKERARLLPTVSAYANYSLLQLSNDFNPFAAGSWFPYNYIGVRAEVPIYDGKQAKLAAADYALRSQINRLNLEKLKADIRYELQSARNTLEQARLDLEVSRKNITLARQIFETDVFRFQQGVLLQNDLKNTGLSLQTAENNYLAAVYNWLVADLGYRKAAGRM